MAIIESIITGVFGIISVILSCFLRWKIKNNEPAKDDAKTPPVSSSRKTKFFMISTTVLAVILITLSVVFIHSSVICPTPFVKIIAPQSATNVSLIQVVEGVSMNVPSEDTIWLIVKSGERYYPMTSAVMSQTYGSWPDEICVWSSTAYLGGLQDSGKKFDILAVIADNDAQDALNRYNDNAKTIQVYAGFTEREWADYQVTVCDSVSVILQVSSNGSTQNSDMPSNNASNQSSSPNSTPITSPSSNKPNISITYPTNNSNVKIFEDVTGTSKNIPSNQKLWIVIHEGNLYYPMVDAVNPLNGQWSYSTTIGNENSTGKIFEIDAVLADSSAQSQFTSWTNAFSTSQHWDMANLPNGATIYEKVFVKRE